MSSIRSPFCTIITAVSVIFVAVVGSHATSLLLTGNEPAPLAVIDLSKPAGAELVKGEWRIHAAKLVEVPFVNAGPDGQPGEEPNTTYDVEPKAGAAGFDDSDWEIIDPASLEERRSTGKVCFMWYRINITIPERIGMLDPTGTTVVFETVVDDYGEIWVDGKLPRTLGQAGGTVVGGFNVPNRVELARDVKPGQQIQIAIFAMNGPISAAPENYIFLRYARLEFLPAAK